MHACARCALRPQPTYRACMALRSWARPGRAGGTRLGLRPNQRFGLGTPRPTGTGGDAKPNSQCVASYVPVCAACGAVPLTVSRNVLCSRRTRCRPISPADRAQCDAHIMPRVCRRRPKSAVCAVLRAWRGMAWRAGRRRSARGRCRRPHLRHRRVVRGELVVMLCILARRSPAPIRADSVCGPSASLRAAQRYPLLLVMVRSAPPTSSATADLVRPWSAA